jgi:hypothetical protein
VFNLNMSAQRLAFVAVRKAIDAANRREDCRTDTVLTEVGTTAVGRTLDSIADRSFVAVIINLARRGARSLKESINAVAFGVPTTRIGSAIRTANRIARETIGHACGRTAAFTTNLIFIAVIVAMAFGLAVRYLFVSTGVVLAAKIFRARIVVVAIIVAAAATRYFFMPATAVRPTEVLGAGVVIVAVFVGATRVGRQTPAALGARLAGRAFSARASATVSAALPALAIRSAV